MSAPGRTGRGSYARERFFPDPEPHAEVERAPSSRPTPLVPLPVMREAYRDGVPVAPDIERRTRRGIGVPIALPSNAAVEPNWVPPADPYSQTEPAEAFALRQPPPLASPPIAPMASVPVASPPLASPPIVPIASPPLAPPPSALPEQEFWERRPSLRPSSLTSLRPSQLPLPPPSFLRRLLTRLVFFTILSAVLLLLATEISLRFHLPWLDPRPGLMRIGAAMTRLWHRVH